MFFGFLTGYCSTLQYITSRLKNKSHIFLSYFLILLLSLIPACSSFKKAKPIFRVAISSEAVAIPFYMASKIGKRISWNIRITPNILQRLDLLKKGTVDAIEWDIVSFYNHVTKHEKPDLVAFLPVKTHYTMFAEKGSTLMEIAGNDKKIVGIDYLGVRSFLLDYWLQESPNNSETVASDQQVIQRLKNKDIQAAILNEDIISVKELLPEYTVLASTNSTNPTVNILVALRTINHNYIKSFLLDYQKIIKKKEQICKSPQKFLPKTVKIPNRNLCLNRIPNNLYFPEETFDNVERWIRLHQPIHSKPLPYSDFFWLNSSEREEK